MKRILTIGDIHGNDVWKKAVYKLDGNDIIECLIGKEYDKVVFVGDYTDAWHKTNVEILHNLKEIIQLKKDYPDNVILLWGNHDVAYYKKDRMITGYRVEMEFDLHELFNDNKKLFQLAYQIDDNIWTHAGIHKGWWNKYVQPIFDKKTEVRFAPFMYEWESIADHLNTMFDFNYEPIFYVGHYRGGYHKEGGPLWADKMETYMKPLEGYHQIMGHTPVKYPRTYTNKKHKLTYVDCLQKKEDFYVLEIKEKGE
jgi:predicted MPP superfamily phosphohydrolase